MYKIGFIGSGKMAAALIKAILQSNFAKNHEILCSDVIDERLEELKQQFGVKITHKNADICQKSEIIVLGFKPLSFPEAIKELTSLIRADQIIISILAGIRISKIQEYLPGRVIRVMPNTGCLVGEMAGGFTVAENVSPDDIRRVKTILDSTGLAVEVSEEELDAVTGLSGSGPAFVAYLIDSFTQAGVAAGLSEPAARQLTLKTFAGTVKLLDEEQMAPAELIKMVSSPQGTTVAGREILESSDVAEIIKKTVLRTKERSRELGQ
jgi:pyrroline-5-carboxylate reductase